ncbi:MAG: CoA pyrophosphatase [Acetobacterales bacterium]
MEQRHLLPAGEAGGGLSRNWLCRRLATLPGADAVCGPAVNGKDLAGYRLDPASLVDSAVLVPLIDRPEGLSVLLTERAAHLGAHAGQISFPGGRIEPTDPSPAAAALRETEEEVGVPPDSVELLARLDSYVTGTGYRITPVIGLICPPLRLRPDAREVAAVFEVPLTFVLEARNHRRVSHTREGVRRRYYSIGWGDRTIWGATAAILVGLSRIVVAAED